MTRRQWLEKNFGARPSKLTHAELASRVRVTQGIAAAARKLCNAVEKWDAIEEAIRRRDRGQDRPGDT